MAATSILTDPSLCALARLPVLATHQLLALLDQPLLLIRRVSILVSLDPRITTRAAVVVVVVVSVPFERRQGVWDWVGELRREHDVREGTPRRFSGFTIGLVGGGVSGQLGVRSRCYRVVARHPRGGTTREAGPLKPRSEGPVYGGGIGSR
jgi:hypothetical protein